MNTSPGKCPKCRERSMTTLHEEYREVLEHDGRSIEVAIPSLQVGVCQQCGYRMHDREANLQITSALRAKAGLLTPVEIRTERIRLRYTQDHFATLLVIGKATLSRWETGAQLQSFHMDEMLRAFFRLTAFRDYLETRANARMGTCSTLTCSAVDSATNSSASVTIPPNLPNCYSSVSETHPARVAS